jgi:diguanylate cyclase (GGDEF)-like protein/PAS domain S-box-containing protein
VGHLSLELLEQIVSLSSECLLVIDASEPEAEIVYANPAYEQKSGYALPELEGSAWLSHAVVEDDAPDLECLKHSLISGDSLELSLPFLRKDGDIWLARLRLTPLVRTGGDRRLWLVQHRPEDRSSGDRAELMKRALGRARQKLASLDRIDQVTGLMSSGHFELLLRRELAVSRREQRELCLLLFEIPEFDTYRRTFGANAADSCLRMIGAQIAGTFRRASDLCARLDESTLAVAILGQDEEQAARLVARVEQKTRNLGLHNPRSRCGRYVFVRGAWTMADPARDNIERFIARARSALEALQGREAPALAESV